MQSGVSLEVFCSTADRREGGKKNTASDETTLSYAEL